MSVPMDWRVVLALGYACCIWLNGFLRASDMKKRDVRNFLERSLHGSVGPPSLSPLPLTVTAVTRPWLQKGTCLYGHVKISANDVCFLLKLSLFEACIYVRICAYVCFEYNSICCV